jgi:Cu-Zn family superoxide dismutase
MSLVAETLRTASVTLMPDFNATVKVVGTAVFNQISSEKPIEITLTLSGLEPNTEHGWHIHAKPVSSGDIVNCTTAGPHFNPLNSTHGSPENNASARHYGDLGNFMTDADGKVDLTESDKLASLYGDFSIGGLGVVIHALKDDFGLGGVPASLLTGNSGARVACGNIVVSKVAPPTYTNGDKPYGTFYATDAAPEATKPALYNSASVAGLGLSVFAFFATLLV